MKIENLIQLYLQGQLDIDGQKKLADLVAVDPEIASQLEIESAYYAKRSSTLRDELKAAKKSNSDIVTKKSSAKIIKMITSIAAVLLVCFLCYFAISTEDVIPTQNNFASTLLTKKHTAPVSLMGNNTTEEKWNAAIKSYKASDYKNVIVSIESIGDPTDEQILYRGVSKLYLTNKDIKGAIMDFEKILLNKESIVADQARWFLALSKLELNENQAAKSILNTIVKSKSWQHGNASQLLNSMK